MRRKSIAMATSLLAVAALAACSTPAGNGSGPDTIIFSSWQFSEPVRGEAFLALVEEFNASQDEVVVRTTNTPFSDYSANLKTQVGAGTGPDVMLLDYDTWVLLQQAGSLADLTDRIEEPAAGFSGLESMTFADDRRFGVIWEAVNYALIMNQDLLDAAGVAAPTDYDEFEAAAKALTTGGQFGFAFRNTMPEEGGWWYDITNWVYGNGGRWTDSDGTPTFTSPEVIRAVTQYRDFFANGYVPQGADAATYRRMFWEGKVAMVIDNNSVPPIFLGQNPEINVTTVPNPFPDAANAANISQLGINANSGAPEAAVAFVNWVLTPEVQAKLREVMVGSTIATPVPPTEQQLVDSPWIEAFASVGEDALTVSPQGAEEFTAQIRHAVLTEMDKVLREGKDPAAAMADAQAAVEAILP